MSLVPSQTLFLGQVRCLQWCCATGSPTFPAANMLLPLALLRMYSRVSLAHLLGHHFSLAASVSITAIAAAAPTHHLPLAFVPLTRPHTCYAQSFPQLDPRVTPRMLYSLCCQAGKVQRVHIPSDSGRPKGFAFIQYDCIDSAVYAYGLFKGTIRLFGRAPDVAFSRSGVTHTLEDLPESVRAGLQRAEDIQASEAAVAAAAAAAKRQQSPFAPPARYDVAGSPAAAGTPSAGHGGYAPDYSTPMYGGRSGGGSWSEAPRSGEYGSTGGSGGGYGRQASRLNHVSSGGAYGTPHSQHSPYGAQPPPPPPRAQQAQPQTLYGQQAYGQQQRYHTEQHNQAQGKPYGQSYGQPYGMKKQQQASYSVQQQQPSPYGLQQQSPYGQQQHQQLPQHAQVAAYAAGQSGSYGAGAAIPYAASNAPSLAMHPTQHTPSAPIGTSSSGAYGGGTPATQLAALASVASSATGGYGYVTPAAAPPYGGGTPTSGEPSADQLMAHLMGLVAAGGTLKYGSQPPPPPHRAQAAPQVPAHAAGAPYGTAPSSGAYASGGYAGAPQADSNYAYSDQSYGYVQAPQQQALGQQAAAGVDEAAALAAAYASQQVQEQQHDYAVYQPAQQWHGYQ